MFYEGSFKRKTPKDNTVETALVWTHSSRKTSRGLKERHTGDGGGQSWPCWLELSGHRSGRNGRLRSVLLLFPTHSDFTPVTTDFVFSTHM